MGSKTNTSNNNNNNKLWLLNWFNGIIKSNNSATQKSSVILPWKQDTMKSTATTSIVITEPINVPPIMNEYTPQQIRIPEQSSITIKASRPSITISESGRRSSQQTTCSSINTDYSSYHRRDSNSSSVISDLWTKAKRHKHPKFHWPHRYHQQQQQQQKEDVLNPESLPSSYRQQSLNPGSLPSSYRQQGLPKHLKRHSISSSFINSTTDNTPSCSRPNSVLYSQPGSPSFAAYLLNNDHIDSYLLNNEKEGLRWFVKHDLIKLAVDGLFSSPRLVTQHIQQKSVEKHILQIGCGDAAWALDIASQFPRWIVIGLDDSNEYHHHQHPQRNFKFIKCTDVLQGLKDFPDSSFDFMTSRFMATSYTFEEYQQILTECIRITKPGGYIEVMEMDFEIYESRITSSCATITRLFNKEIINVIEAKSWNPKLAIQLKKLITDPVVSAEIKFFSLPLGIWGGTLGVMFRDDVHKLIELFQEQIAVQNEKRCRTEDELDYKMEIMDSEMQVNRAFMNLHVMIVST